MLAALFSRAGRRMPHFLALNVSTSDYLRFLVSDISCLLFKLFFLFAQSNIPDAIQHYLLALQLEPGFTPAVERLKIIQCVLWKQQKALEKEAADLRKLLTRKQV